MKLNEFTDGEKMIEKLITEPRRLSVIGLHCRRQNVLQLFFLKVLV